MDNHGGFETIIGTNADDTLFNTPDPSPSNSLGESVIGAGGNDVLNLTAPPGPFATQIHAYGQAGDDILNLGFGAVSGYTVGHHVWGDYFDRSNETAPRGRDIFNFTDFDAVNGVVVGRLDDFDPASDRIQIDGVDLDLNNLPDGVRVVEYNGDHTDQALDPQQWLLIDTGEGYLFYALDGARIDPGLVGGPPSLRQEVHFVGLDASGLDAFFADMPDVQFTDPENYVPVGLSPQGGAVINDIDLVVEDVTRVVSGTREGDLIAAGLNDDEVQAGAGDDYVWGGSGEDLIRGGSGADTLDGGAGDDVLSGGGGADQFVYASGDGADVITDFTPGTDRIDLTDTGIASFDDLEGRITQGAQGAVIDLGAGDTLLLRDVDVDALTPGDLLTSSTPTRPSAPDPDPDPDTGVTGKVRPAPFEESEDGGRRFSFDKDDDGFQVVRGFDLRSSDRDETSDVLSVEIDGVMQDASSEAEILELVRLYQTDTNGYTNTFVDVEQDYLAFADEDASIIIMDVADAIGIGQLLESGAELLA